jgi:hypothetical protein
VHENEPSPTNHPDQPVSEQIPHSGIHHDEHPVDEFDNTPLPEAVERGLVNPTPNTPAGLEPTDPTEKKSHKKLVIGGAAFLAGAAVIAGSVIGIKAAGDAPKNTAPAPDPKATSQTPEATPTPSSTPEQPLTVQSLEIPANLTPEQLGVTLIQDRLSQWEMAGATDANTTAWHQAPNLDAFVLDLGQQNADKFSQALFVDGWQTDSSLASFSAAEQKSNAHTVENFFKTNHVTASEKAEFPMDFKPYNRSISVAPADVKFVSQSPGEITLSILATEHDNKDRNRIGTTLSNDNQAQIEGNRFRANVTLKNVNGIEKIAAISITNP